MTPLEAAQSRHFLTERHKGFRLCSACLMSWPCDFQVQRDEAFRLGAEVELLLEELTAIRYEMAGLRDALTAYEDVA